MIVKSDIGIASESESTASTNILQSSEASNFSPHLSANVLLQNLFQQN